MATPFNIWFQSVTPPVASIPPSGNALLGLFSATQSIGSIQTVASHLGVTSTLKGYSFFTSGSSWSSIGSWTVPGTLPAGSIILLGVNMVADPPATISQLTANIGQYATLASHLPNGTIVRLGWEFDIGTGTGGFGHVLSQSNFISGWQQIYTTMKAVNTTLKFDLCCNTGTSTLTQLQTWYPGDAFVDYLGGDHYNTPNITGGDFSAFGPAVQWAASHNKPISCGEWGLATSQTKDDPAFINAAGQFFNNPAAATARYASFGGVSYTAGYQSYFNDQAEFGEGLDSGLFPLSLAAYTSNFS